MRTKVTLVLLFLNVALFFFIFKFERNWRIERASLEARRRVLGAEAADVRTLEISSVQAGRSYRLERRGENWWLTQPLEWPANPPAVNRLINELLFLEHVTSFAVADLAKNGQSLADYGLDKPKMTVTFHSGESAQGPNTTLLIGDTTKVGNQLYILSPDGARVHVVGRGLADSLGLPLEQLRADTLLTIPVFEARSLKLQPAAPLGVAVYLRRDGNRWLFGTPLTARGSKDAVELVINELNSLRVKAFVTAAPGVPSPASAPALRVTMEGNNRLESLLIGAVVAGNPTSTSETDYYAQFEDRSALRAALFTVTISNSLMDKLRDAQEKLRETHILDFDSRQISNISLSAPNQGALVLQKLDTTAAVANAPVRVDAWQITRRGEAPTNLAATTADRVAVERLLEQLALLEAKKFLTESASANDLENWGFNRPEREISLAQGGSSPSTLVLQIGLSSERDGPAYARLGPSTNPGASIYVIDRKILAETPVAPFYWRERTLRELPSTARVTSLKLVDLNTHATIFETSIDATGQPDKSARNPAALTTLVAQLRTLRAKRFVQENFTDKIATPLGEKTWRYELTSTVSLPGGSASEQSLTSTLLLTERFGGGEQVAGAKEFDAMFELEQPMLDALWTLIYGADEPGPAPVPDTAPPFVGAASAPGNVPTVPPALLRPTPTSLSSPSASAPPTLGAEKIPTVVPAAPLPTPTPTANPLPAPSPTSVSTPNSPSPTPTATVLPRSGY